MFHRIAFILAQNMYTSFSMAYLKKMIQQLIQICLNHKMCLFFSTEGLQTDLTALCPVMNMDHMSNKARQLRELTRCPTEPGLQQWLTPAPSGSSNRHQDINFATVQRRWVRYVKPFMHVPTTKTRLQEIFWVQDYFSVWRARIEPTTIISQPCYHSKTLRLCDATL